MSCLLSAFFLYSGGWACKSVEGSLAHDRQWVCVVVCTRHVQFYVDDSHHAGCLIFRYVQTARDEGNDVYQECATIPQEGLFYPPTLITNVQTTSTVVQEEIFGPVIAAMPFRTAKEALALANQTR